MTGKTPADAIALCDFWFGAHAKPKWWDKDADFDAEIRRRFGALQGRAAAGDLSEWEETTKGSLALIVLLDQVPRNIYRDTPRAFATDSMALALAKRAIERGHDRDLEPEERLFLYMPFQHSENLKDQKRCVALIESLGTENTAEYAQRHLEIIERFGRFPHRNRILGRASTDEELAFLETPNSSF